MEVPMIDRPINEKTHKHFMFHQMEKLSKGEIDVQHANAMCNISGKITAINRTEHSRANLLMKIRKHNYEFKDNVELRELDYKNF